MRAEHLSRQTPDRVIMLMHRLIEQLRDGHMRLFA
jgi:hypothetical protein